MRFPPDFIDRLKAQLPISEVIGRRIPLRKAGREYKACCPFHGEKTPSFTVNDEKEFFHCFGCGAHGDVIGFVKDYDKLTYPEAVEKLAAEAGLPLPAVSPREEERYKKQLSLYDAVEEAAAWFQKQLATPAAAEAREYLERRGIRPEMIAAFRLGFAPNERGALKQHLLKKGISEAMQLEAGLIAPSDMGESYDRFRNRIIFPITDTRGRPVAFGGRILPSMAEQVRAKYLNSPETPLFKKGELLYGLHPARRAIGETGFALVAEGYLDVIALHQAGFRQAVAPLGTALTAEQLQALWRLTPEPILCLDGDAAGQRAMLRAGNLALPLITAGMGLKFAVLPEGEDPDSLILSRGREAMQAVLDNAISLSEMLWQTHSAQVGTRTPEQRARLEALLSKLAAGMQDATLRQHFREFFRRRVRDLPQEGKPGAKRGAQAAKPSPAVAALMKESAEGPRRRFEEQLFRLLLRQPALFQFAEIEEEFARIAFADKQLDKLRDAILKHQSLTEAMNRESLVSFLAACGLTDVSQRIQQSSANAEPRSLRAREVNLREAAEIWRQVIGAYAQFLEAGNDNIPMDERRLAQLREQVGSNGDRPRAHLIFPEEK
jgi:DNA primase